jgi:hypothetical protein
MVDNGGHQRQQCTDAHEGGGQNNGNNGRDNKQWRRCHQITGQWHACGQWILNPSKSFRQTVHISLKVNIFSYVPYEFDTW